MSAHRRPEGARVSALVIIGIGAASGAAHLGNNFTTYLVGGLIDRFGFSPIQMGAWSMAETLAYAAAMFLVAPRAQSVSARTLGLAATLLVVAAQLGSVATGAYPLLLIGRIAAGLGFGLMNSAVNLAAGQTAHPARAISAGIAFQTVLFAAVNIGLPMLGVHYGVEGMFAGLAGLSAVLGLGTFLLPGRRSDPADSASAQTPVQALGAEGWRILAAMALFAFGSLAIWPFMERAAHGIGLSATMFGQYQSAATILSACGNMALFALAARLSRARPLALALGTCGMACALMTTVSSALAFAGALILYNVSWFITYPLLLGLAYSIEPSGRLALMTTGTWLLFQSFGSLGAGVIGQVFGGYGPVGPMGLGACLLAILTVWPVARRLDGAHGDLAAGQPVTVLH
ncbi:MFS transporter [Novosphingobium sp. Chol11]|uniref:MFS transporter n=1 Tax=Novosphingobium sp. Chol11 TaxID=1385763 RepID=UPI0025F33354|nr:MFS transporter [Novosphingobium sp. Chol11]